MKLSALRPHALAAPFGLLLGSTLSGLGFSNFGEVNRMLTLADLRLTLAFMLGVVLSLGGFLLLDRSQVGVQRPLHRGIVPGSLLFGVGWALTGTCPGVVLVQIGEGYLPALVTLTGMLLGMVLYKPMHARYFNWPTDSCGS